MAYSITLGEFTDKEFHILNFYCLYLHVTMISELFNIEGTKILKHMVLCERSLWFNSSIYITMQISSSAYQRKIV